MGIVYSFFSWMGNVCSFFSSYYRPLGQKKEIGLEVVEFALLKLRSNDLTGLKKCLDAFAKEDRPKIFQDMRMMLSLHYCVYHGDTHMMDYLLQIAPEIVDAVTKNGFTPLFQAARWRMPHIVKRLLDWGASVPMTEAACKAAKCRVRPFIHAVIACKDKNLIHRVIKAGADTNVVYDGIDCACVAAFHCSLDTFQYVREKSKTYASVEELAGFAFYGRQLDTVKMLLKEKHDNRFLISHLIDKAVWMESQYLEKVLPMLKEIGAETMEIMFHEVLGAHHILQHNLQKGIEAWQAAMRLRWKDPTSPLLKEPLENFLEDILQTAELQTMADVENLPLQRPQLLTHAVLTLQRHIGRFKLCFESIICLAEELIHAGEIQQGLVLLKRLVSTQSMNLTLEKTMHVFRLAAVKSPQEVNVKDFLFGLTHCRYHLYAYSEAMKCGVEREHDAKCPSCTSIKTVTNTFVLLLSLLSELGVNATHDEEIELRKELTEFMLLCSKQCHEVLFHGTMNNCQSLHPAAMKTLVAASNALALRGDTSGPLHLARDKEGRTPLHVYAQSLCRQKLIDDGVLECFLDHGADLCTKDNSGESIRDVLVARGIVSGGAFFPSLKCLAARLVAGMSPELLSDFPDLRDFVLKH